MVSKYPNASAEAAPTAGNRSSAYPNQQRVVVMSGISLQDGQFAKMPLEEAVVNRDCNYLCGAIMDMGVARHYYSPFCGSSTLRRLEIGNQVTVLKAYQFSRCNALNPNRSLAL